MLVWSRTITGRVHWDTINKLVKIHALNSLNIKAWLGLIFLAIAMGLLLFVPGTAQYWQAWICLAVFFGDVTVKPCSRAKFVGMSHGHLTFVACRPHYSLDRVFDADCKLFSNLFDLYCEQVSYILCSGPTG
jgi:hypothetical protein